MCRNIQQLRRPGSPPTDEEIHDAALQFVRKVSGYRVPSAVNRPAFETAVDDVAAAVRSLLDALPLRENGPALAPMGPRARESGHRERSRLPPRAPQQ